MGVSPDVTVCVRPVGLGEDDRLVTLPAVVCVGDSVGVSPVDTACVEDPVEERLTLVVCVGVAVGVSPVVTVCVEDPVEGWLELLVCVGVAVGARPVDTVCVGVGDCVDERWMLAVVVSVLLGERVSVNVGVAEHDSEPRPTDSVGLWVLLGVAAAEAVSDADGGTATTTRRSRLLKVSACRVGMYIDCCRANPPWNALPHRPSLSSFS